MTKRKIKQIKKYDLSNVKKIVLERGSETVSKHGLIQRLRYLFFKKMKTHGVIVIRPNNNFSAYFEVIE